eukprot:6604374-Prymnesium_polylepis.3
MERSGKRRRGSIPEQLHPTPYAHAIQRPCWLAGGYFYEYCTLIRSAISVGRSAQLYPPPPRSVLAWPLAAKWQEVCSRVAPKELLACMLRTSTT